MNKNRSFYFCKQKATSMSLRHYLDCWKLLNNIMVKSRIKFVGDLDYATPEELLEAENGKEIVVQYSDAQRIPIRVLDLGNRGESDCIVLAGDGALYPWKVGQKVEVDYIKGLITMIEYLRELRIRGYDNSHHQNFMLFDSITPIIDGESSTDKDSLTFKGIVSFEWFKEIGEFFWNYNYTHIKL